MDECMKLIASGVNKQFLSSYLPKIGDEVDGVLAAIAYGDDTDTLLKNCIDNKSDIRNARFNPMPQISAICLEHRISNK